MEVAVVQTEQFEVQSSSLIMAARIPTMHSVFL